MEKEEILPAPLELVASGTVAKTPDAERRPWPATAVEQFAALGALVAQRHVNADEATAHFASAKRDHVVRHLETLALMGEVTLDVDGRYQATRKVA